MIRRVLTITAAFALGASSVWAQSGEFTVRAPSAGVYKFPTTASPVIGHVASGTVLEVSRDLGSWVRISWPSGEGGIAYLHVSTGSLTRPLSPDPAKAAGAPPGTARETGPAVDSPWTGAVDSNQRPVIGSRASPPALPPGGSYVEPPTHVVGIGARADASIHGFGASGRAWLPRRLGAQFAVSRETRTGTTLPGRMTSVQFAPSVLVSFGDHVSDYVSLRPYIGGGASLYQQTLSSPAAGVDSSSQHSLGLQTLGGFEATLAGLPQFAFSADVGYRWLHSPLQGFDLGGPTIAVSGHWYVR